MSFCVVVELQIAVRMPEGHGCVGIRKEILRAPRRSRQTTEGRHDCQRAGTLLPLQHYCGQHDAPLRARYSLGIAPPCRNRATSVTAPGWSVGLRVRPPQTPVNSEPKPSGRCDRGGGGRLSGKNGWFSGS